MLTLTITQYLYTVFIVMTSSNTPNTLSNKIHLPYRQGVGLMIINHQKKVFVGKRADMVNSQLLSSWQMPQGGIDHEEDPYTAALREMMEEVGTNNVTLIAESKQPLGYDLPDELLGKLWGGRYGGQQLRWFLFRYEGYDQDINIKTKHPEFCEWKWVDPQEVLEMGVYFKKEVYRKILQEFSPYLT